MEIEINKITPGLFDNIIAYTVAEPGAMGFSNSMEIVDDKGKYFVISFDEIPFASVKNFFPTLADCIFNGPMPGEAVEEGEIVIYPNNNDDKNCRRTTRVAKGWKHIYIGAGNHLIIKEEIFPLLAEYIQNKSPSEIYATWDSILKEIS